MPRPIAPDANQLWGEAADQVKKRLLGGPFRFDDQGRLLTAEGPQRVSPAFRFGAQRGGKLRAVGEPKRSRANAAAAIHAPANLPTWDHLSTVIRTSRGGRTRERPAFAKPGHRAAYKQLPGCEERKNLAAVSLRGPNAGEMRGFIPQTPLFGAIAAALNYNTVSRVKATQAARWLRVVRMGFCRDFGIVVKGSCV